MPSHAQRKTIDLRLIAPVKLRESFFIAPGRALQQDVVSLL
jgi:bifunctional N-acetylglucosamine-1-phosphate-uridyltransferase/glucosamine-1-phosphate-acetyltransferase GlmU-like protein